MADIGILVLMVVAGFGLGVLYFSGLWLQLRWQFAAGQQRWGLRMAAGLGLRLLLLAAGFFLLMAGDWRRLLLLATGFWLSRLLLVKRFASRRSAGGQAERP